MKEYPTLIHFDSATRLMACRHSLNNNNIISKNKTTINHEDKRETKPNSAVTYLNLFEDENQQVELSLSSKTVLLLPSEHQGQINEFSLEGKLGKGRFSTVYKARRHVNGKNYGSDVPDVVAMKCMTKKPTNSIFSMNQILKQRARWKNTSTIAEADQTFPNQTSATSFSSISAMDNDWFMIEMNLLRIRKECMICAQLTTHENICRLFQLLDSPQSDKVWMVQEYCSLGELKWERASKIHIHAQWEKFMRSNNITSSDFALKILKDASSGLAFLQSHGIIHRDIKPSNILLFSDSQLAKLCDFGCSIVEPSHLPWWKNTSNKAQWEKAYQEEFTKIVGSPAFTPPELCDFIIDSSSNDQHRCTFQHSRKQLLDIDINQSFKIDTWALGVTIYCIMENCLPFLGDNEFDTYHLIAYSHPPLDMNTFALQTKDFRWLYNYVLSKLLCKDLTKRAFASEIQICLSHHERESNSIMNRVKKRISSWRRCFTKIPSTKPSVAPSDTFMGTIFSHSSSSDFSVFTADSSIDSKSIIQHFNT